MRLLIEYVFKDSSDPRRLVNYLLAGYDIIRNANKTVKVSPEHLPEPNGNEGKTLTIDNIYDFSVSRNKLVVFVEIKDESPIHIVDYIWVKYILDPIEENVYIKNIEILDRVIDQNISFMEKKIKKAYKIAYGGARGVILKWYNKLTNEWIIKTAKKLFDRGCDIIKEDETFFTDPDSLAHRIESISDFDDKIYVYNSLSLTPSQISNSRKDSLLTSPLVPYIAVGFSRVTKWFQQRHLVWAHRQGYPLIERSISKQVYLKLALLAGATFIHTGTPQVEEDFYKLQDLINGLKRIRPFIPVFTGVPNRKVEEKLLNATNNIAVFLSPIYWDDCK